MPLCFAVSIFVLVSLFSLPAAAKDHEVEGKVGSISATAEGGFSFQLEGEAELCRDGKTAISKGGLVSQAMPVPRALTQHTPNWLMDLLMEAKRSGRPVRVLSRPARAGGSSYCRILRITLL